MFNTISNWIEAKHHALAARAIDVWVQKKGQGTTEYAILVGVLVVIAIIAITLSAPRSKNSGMPSRAGSTGSRSDSPYVS